MLPVDQKGHLRRVGRGGDGHLPGVVAVEAGEGLFRGNAVHIQAVLALVEAHRFLRAAAEVAVHLAVIVAQLLEALLHFPHGVAGVALFEQRGRGRGRGGGHAGLRVLGIEAGARGFARDAVAVQPVLGLKNPHRLGCAGTVLAVHFAVVIAQLLEALLKARHLVALDARFEEHGRGGRRIGGIEGHHQHAAHVRGGRGGGGALDLQRAAAVQRTGQKQRDRHCASRQHGAENKGDGFDV